MRHRPGAFDLPLEYNANCYPKQFSAESWAWAAQRHTIEDSQHARIVRTSRRERDVMPWDLPRRRLVLV